MKLTSLELYATETLNCGTADLHMLDDVYSILAEDASQIAAGEEHRTGAAGAADTGLLPIVGSGPGHLGKRGRTAEPRWGFGESFCPTLAGTIVTKNIHSGNSSE